LSHAAILESPSCPTVPFEVKCDLLYWQAREDGTAIALNEGEVLYPDFDYHLGVRLLGAWQMSHDAWRVGVQLTHFHARTTDNFPFAVVPTQPHPLRGINLATEAFSRWRLHLGFVDLFLARTAFYAPCITPFIAVRFAGVRFKTRVEYTLPSGKVEDLSNKNKFWGIGPQFGLVIEQALWRSLSLYAKGDLSLLLGSFYIHQDEQEKNNKKAGRMKFLDEKTEMRAVGEMALGLCWSFSCFDIHAAWELTQLFGQNQMVQFVDAETPGLFLSNLGDLTLQGWTVGLSYCF